MQVDAVFILAAGKGTRMGEIGKVLPKLLWPVFEKSLLELQIEYARQLCPKKPIYVNTYYNSEKIENFIEESSIKNLFKLIKEQKPLDIGGAIHNLAKELNYSGNILILNGDQFLCFTRKTWSEVLEEFNGCDALLLGYPVNSNAGYNALRIGADGFFKGVTPNSEIGRNEEMITYTGTSLINLSSLEPTEGESKFFESVANPTRGNIKVVNLRNFEYWDFGTSKRHYETHFKALRNPNSMFFDLLQTCGAIDTSKISSGGYEGEGIIRLSHSDMTLADGTISFKEINQKLDD